MTETQVLPAARRVNATIKSPGLRAVNLRLAKLVVFLLFGFDMTKTLFFSFLLFLLAQSYAYSQYKSPEDARDYLLYEVEKIAKAGVPGPLMLSGKTSFPVMVGSIGGETQAPVVAASYWGEGVVLAFGHPGYFEAGAFNTYETAKLLEHGARWTAGKNNPRVLVRGLTELSIHLRQQGFEVSENDGSSFTADYLNNYDVLIIDPERLRLAEIPLVQAFVKSGKGLMASGLGWGWMQLNPGKSLQQDMKGNILLAEAGITWINGYIGGDYIKAQKELSPYFNSTRAVNFINTQPMTTENRKDYGQALSVAMQAIKQSPTMTRFKIENSFPGKVSADAPGVRKILSVNTEIPRWHSTGLYAAAGDEIRVQIPPALVKKGYAIRIGSHADLGYHHDKWERHPEVTLNFELNSEFNSVFNPFGGLIYIEVPEKQQLGLVDVSIAGAVEAPHFILGKTNLHDWINTIRNHPAPWAELEGEGMIITLQSEKIRNLDRPDKVIRFWDEAQKNNQKLAHWPIGENRPMRIVFDIQISAGYMHSGYPVMSSITDYGEQEDILDPQGDHWGFYHELGHNHQHPDWTFAGTGEVTCNLFTLYNIEHLQRKKRQVGDDQDYQRSMVNEYFSSGSPFGTWKGTAFLALEMYNQLIEVYGWQALENVIRQYTLLKPEDRPRTDQEKMDMWLVIYSTDVGENLEAFFDQWGMPITQGAKSKVRHLPPADLDRLLANMKLETSPKPEGVMERFKYQDGFFVKRQGRTGIEWVEQKPDGSDSFLFTQYGEDDTYFYINKNGTNMNMRVPKKIGWVQYSYGDDGKWNNLYKTIPF